MKHRLTICLTFGLLVSLSQAQEPSPATASELSNAVTVNPDDQAYASLAKKDLELNTQIKLLNTLAQDHRKLAEEAAKAIQADKALWENDLARNLNDKGLALQQQLRDVTTQRLALEKARANAPLSVGGSPASPPNTPALAFLNKLDEGLQRVEQELITAHQDASVYASQIATNSMPYGFEKASDALEQNARRVRQLEQERFDLELRKLEFLALRTP